MTATRYLGSITPPPPSLAVVPSGGSITTQAGTYYFWLVNRCVGGFTKASATSSTATLAAGDHLDIIIPGSARTSGSDVREFYILANTVNDSSTASIIASYPGFTLAVGAQSPNDYSETATVLPGTLAIATDEQLELNKFITYLVDLPSGGDLVNGMMRQVDEVGAYLTYNIALDDWFELVPNTVNPNISTTTNPGEPGCDRDIRAITTTDKTQIITPVYGMTGISRTVPIIIANTESTNIPAGKPIEALVEVGGVDYSRYTYFIPRGIVNLTTGILDVSGQPSLGGSFAADGEGGATLSLEKDLIPGSAFWFDVNLQVSPADLGNTLREGSYVEFYASFSPINSKKTPDAGIFGDIIGPVADYGRIIPNGPMLAPIITSRAGKIRGYTFPVNGLTLSAAEVIGLQLNTPAQNIVLTSNGIAYKAEATPVTASLRAIVSTEDGVGIATAFAGSHAVTNATLLQLTLTHPTTVRSNYPDILGTDQQVAQLNASKVRVYVRPTIGGDISYYDKAITGITGEIISVGAGAGTNIGVTLPAVDSDFGLFEMTGYVGSTTAGASVFATSTVEVAIAYLYEGTVTSITHDPLVLAVEAAAQGDETRYVREVQESFWALFGLLDTIGLPLSTVVEAKALGAEKLSSYKLFFVAETERVYYWNSVSVDLANDITVIAITGIVTGRLIAVTNSGERQTEIVTESLTLAADKGKDYLVDASGSGMVLTLPDAGTVLATTKHQLMRMDSSANTVQIVCSGGDLLNGAAGASFLSAETAMVFPVTGGYSLFLAESLPLLRKRRILGGVTLYVSPSGSDANTGLSSLPGEALQTLKGVADKINQMEAYWYEIYLEPGATIEISLLSATVSFAPTTSRIRTDGTYVETYVDFFGDGMSPPTLLFSGVNDELLLQGKDVFYGFSSVNFSLTASAVSKSPLRLQGSKVGLYLAESTVTRVGSGTYTFIKASPSTEVLLAGITSVGQLVALVEATGATITTYNTLSLDSFSNAIFDLKKNALLDQNATISLSGAGRQFVLDTGSVIKNAGGVIPGSEGDIYDSGSSISSLTLSAFRTVNLGTYAATGSVTWNLRNGYGAYDALLTITNGIITLSVTNPPIVDYVLTGVLSIDAALGEIVLPVTWTLTTDSANPNDATGIYRFIVRYSSLLTSTHVIFSPISGGIPPTVDLSYTASATNGLITNTKGTEATLPLATEANAGLMAPAAKVAVALVSPLIYALTWTDTVGTTMDADTGSKRIFTLTINGTTGTITQTNIPTAVRYDFELYLNLVAGTPTVPITWSKGDAFPLTPGEYSIAGVTYDNGSSFILRVLPC